MHAHISSHFYKCLRKALSRMAQNPGNPIPESDGLCSSQRHCGPPQLHNWAAPWRRKCLCSRWQWVSMWTTELGEHGWHGQARPTAACRWVTPWLIHPYFTPRATLKVTTPNAGTCLSSTLQIELSKVLFYGNLDADPKQNPILH